VLVYINDVMAALVNLWQCRKSSAFI